MPDPPTYASLAVHTAEIISAAEFSQGQATSDNIYSPPPPPPPPPLRTHTHEKQQPQFMLARAKI